MEIELAPIRARAAELSAAPQKIDQALAAGAEKAGKLAKQTLGAVKDVMGIS